MVPIPDRMPVVRRKPHSSTPTQARDGKSKRASRPSAAARKRAQQALRQSEECFSKTFRALSTPTVISRLADGVIVEVNQAWERENGIAREDAIGRPGATVGHWSDLEARARIVQQVNAEGRADNHMVRFVRRGGKTRDVLVSCTRIDLGGEPHLLWNSRDITELRAAEEAVRKSEQRFRALVELSSDWYWETDSQHR